MPELENLGRIVEALIFAADGPVSIAQLRRALPHVTPAQVAEIVKQVNESLARDERPYEIYEISGGYQFRTRPEYADKIRSMQPDRRMRLSRAALETLSVIAYRQPITRAEIEDLRCVDCGGVLKGLLDRSLIRIMGRRDVPGRPVLYGTTAAFLETFSLKSLRDLPELREIEDLEPPAMLGKQTGEDGDTRGVEEADREGADPATSPCENSRPESPIDGPLGIETAPQG